MQHCYLCNATIPDGTGRRVRVKVGESDNFGISWSRHPHARSSHRTQYGERIVCESCGRARRRAQSVGNLFLIGIGTVVCVAMCSHQPASPPTTTVAPATAAIVKASPTPPKPAANVAKSKNVQQLTPAQKACMQKAVEENADLARCK